MKTYLVNINRSTREIHHIGRGVFEAVGDTSSVFYLEGLFDISAQKGTSEDLILSGQASIECCGSQYDEETYGTAYIDELILIRPEMAVFEQIFSQKKALKSYVSFSCRYNVSFHSRPESGFMMINQKNNLSTIIDLRNGNSIATFVFPFDNEALQEFIRHETTTLLKINQLIQVLNSFEGTL